jgi:hypothetical protein
MSDPPPDREGQVLRATVTLTGWDAVSAEDIADTIERVAGARIAIDDATPPVVVLDRSLPEDAKNAAARLTAAGATVSVEEVWVTRGESHEGRARPACPVCGSSHTQSFGHAGPAAPVNRKCTDCGHLFRSRSTTT